MRLGRTPFLRRLWLGLGLVLAFALAGCGASGIKFNEFLPKRIIIIGDEITYVGCNTATSNGQTVCAGADKFDRFSINSISGSSALVNNWVVRLAANYGLTSDKIIEPTVAGNNVRAAKLGAIAKGVSTSYAGAMSVETQADNIPNYVAGDMVVVAGGTNDILDVLNKNESLVPSASTVTLRRGLTTSYVNRIRSDLGISETVISTNKAFQLVKAAQDYQDIALSLIQDKGQKNVFLVPVYDFSNSPDLGQFCSGCSSATQAKQGVALFNFILRLLTDNSFEPMTFRSQDPRILVTSGTTSYDLFYANITYLTHSDVSAMSRTAVYDFDVSPSVCGASSTLSPQPTSLSNCTWNGLFTTTENVDPVFKVNGSDYSNAPFITAKGKYIYAQNQYLTPLVHTIIGDTFSIFMRGYNGW